ncbi:MAG: cell wall hydrolase [Clostridiaceae bacterium]|nr:cell wall hydrolase [Clostridiaceae bacterium]
MNKLVKGAVTALATTGMMVVLPQNKAVAQAPTGSAVMVGGDYGESSGITISLLPNQIYKTEEQSEQEEQESIAAIAVQNEAKQKIASLDESRDERVQAEKLRAEKLRKKRLAAKKAKQEEKRKQEIAACCGVAAGSKDRQILERIVEAEAGGESIKGRLLVANVVLNRVKSKQFPSTIEAVVFAHRGSTYQFSPVSDGSYYSVTVSKGTKQAVDQALNGKDPSQGALYFMERSLADSSNVSWFDRALTRLFQYGCHEFYK